MVFDRFSGLGTTIESGLRLIEHVENTFFDDLRQQVSSFEERFSRFRLDSELSRLNASAGKPVVVSPDMFQLLVAARHMWQWSDGFFDPTVGAALEAAGYDASFERLPTDRPDASVGQPSSSVSFADVRLDPGDVSITLPAGVRIDLGGIGKGYLLDAVQRRAQTITEDYWLSFGGDLFVSGRDDENQSWRIAVQSAEHLEEDIGLLEAPAGQWAISTSGTTKRKGVRAGRAWHHLINPRTMQPSDSPVLAVTALARSALEADVAAKTILLRGPEDGLNWARSKSIEALLQLPRANFIMTPAMRSIFQAQQ